MHCSTYSFRFPRSPIIIQWEPVGWCLSPFDTTTIVSDGFFAFWCNKMSHNHLIQFLPQCWDQLFLQGALVPFTRKLFLETLILVITLGLVIVSRYLQWPKLISTKKFKKKIYFSRSNLELQGHIHLVGFVLLHLFSWAENLCS